MMTQEYTGHCDRCSAAYRSEVPPLQEDWSEVKIVMLSDDATPVLRSWVWCDECTADFKLWEGTDV